MSRDWVDFVNAAGSIGTLGAFGFLFYQQWKSDKHQKRIEIESTQQQLRGNIQQFENSFFNLLSLHNNIVDQLYYLQKGFANFTPDTYSEGKAIFDDARSKIYHIVTTKLKDELNPGIDRAITSIEEAKDILTTQYYKYYYRGFEKTLNHYFRNLYHIYKYIDQSDLISDTLRKRYSSILRAQLSQNELYVIMFNMMIKDYGYPKMLIYETKYKILKNFRKSDPELKYYLELFEHMRSRLPLDTDQGIELVKD